MSDNFSLTIRDRTWSLLPIPNNSYSVADLCHLSTHHLNISVFSLAELLKITGYQLSQLPPDHQTLLYQVLRHDQKIYLLPGIANVTLFVIDLFSFLDARNPPVISKYGKNFPALVVLQGKQNLYLFLEQKEICSFISQYISLS